MLDFLAQQRPVPRTFVRGKGSRCWDSGGYEYIDYTLAYGTLVLGHAHEGVNQAVCQRLASGTIFSLSHPLAEELIVQLLEIFPYTSRAILQKTGSDATSTAVRLARACTGRDLILRAGYHGWHEWCVDAILNEYPADHDPKTWRTGSPGVPRQVSQLTKRIDCNDIDTLEHLLKNDGDTIACIVIAPEEMLPPLKDNLAFIRQLATQYGIILIFDEIKTAFRIALGGVQEHCGIFPDITTVSKAMANGFPISAVVGRHEVMQVANKVFTDNTFQEELVAITAALTTIEIIKKEKVIEHIWYVGNRLVEGINAIISQLGLEGFVEARGWPLAPMPFIYFHNTLNDRHNIQVTFNNKLSELGIFMFHDHPNFISFSHSDKDIDLTLEACHIALASIKELI